MKHLITFSLVFFSLSHLAQAHRAEMGDVLNARYCDDKAGNQRAVQTKEFKKQPIPGLLNQGELSLIGMLPSQRIKTIVGHRHVSINLTLRHHPRNNIP